MQEKIANDPAKLIENLWCRRNGWAILAMILMFKAMPFAERFWGAPALPAKDTAWMLMVRWGVLFLTLIWQVSPAGAAPTVSPVFAYVNYGQKITLTATASGTPPFFYQWYYGDALTPLAGATNATLTLTNIQPIHTPGNLGTYTASAGNSAGSQGLGGNCQVIEIPLLTALKVLPLGDSITYGQGAPGGYRAPLYQDLINGNFNVNFVGTQNNNPVTWLSQTNHEGHSGYRIDQIASGFLSWVKVVPKPDVILLLIGTNDYGQTNDTAHATNRLDQLIQLIATNQPQARLIVANLTLRTDNPALEQLIETTYNPLVPGIVAKHAALGQLVSFVDLHSVVNAAQLSDGLHPNAAGYNQMAAAWLAAISQVVTNPANKITNLTLGSGTATLSYRGIPGFHYLTQRSTNLSTGAWLPIHTNVASINGMFQVQDAFLNLGGTPPSAFYRLVEQ